MNRILVATDGSPPSAEAADVAIELASEHRSELSFVHVVPRLDVVTAGDFMPSDMQAAFWKSLLNVTRDPGSLDSQLAHLDQVQAASYAKS